MSTPDLPSFTRRLNSLITSDQASSDLRRYFGIDLQPEAVPFTTEVLPRPMPCNDNGLSSNEDGASGQ
ncbi:hypothetical protein ABZV80_38885 [Streptomyces sp. NPDC005132]|uniref:hypothetical protein n=1 Tax=Streptomyces sp. NPDC005132 TaxID=3154294 RepID=UPI0033A6E34D